MDRRGEGGGCPLSLSPNGRLLMYFSSYHCCPITHPSVSNGATCGHCCSSFSNLVVLFEQVRGGARRQVKQVCWCARPREINDELQVFQAAGQRCLRYGDFLLHASSLSQVVSEQTFVGAEPAHMASPSFSTPKRSGSGVVGRTL